METINNAIAKFLMALDPNPGARIKIVQDDIQATAKLLTEQSSYFEAIYNLFISIGLGLAIMYFLLDLMNIAATTELTMEKVVKSFIKLCLACLLVKCGYQVLIIIANIGSTLAEGITINPNVVDLTNPDLALKSMWDALIVVAGLLPLALTFLIVFVCSKIILYSRLVEVAINLVLSPIALADIPTGGLRSNGVTFLRKFLGLSLQTVVMVLIMAVFYELSDTVGLGAGIDTVLVGVGGSIAGASGAIGALGAGATGVFNFLATLTGSSFAAGAYMLCAIYLTIIYVTEAVIMLSFLFKSKQIAMDIVGMG